MPRTKLTRLTDEQAALVAEQAEWVPKWVILCVSRRVICRIGWDAVVYEAWLYVMRSAMSWNPELGMTFRTYAMGAVKNFLPLYLWRKTRHPGFDRVWRRMPQSPEGESVADLLPARPCRGAVCPLLALWCSPEAKAQRAGLNMRERLVLCLRRVECWTLQECGEALGVSPQAVRRVEVRAVEKIRNSRESAGAA